MDRLFTYSGHCKLLIIGTLLFAFPAQQGTNVAELQAGYFDCIAPAVANWISSGIMKNEVLIVFVSAATQEEAARISEVAVKSHYAACATTIPAVRSTYWWEGKLVNEQESIVLFKTTTDRFDRLQEAIRSVHSYQTPEIIAVPVIRGFPPYLEWVQKETTVYGEG